MKTCFIASILLLCCFYSNAQTPDSLRSIAVSNNRTTSIVFPSSIVSVDRGSERIVVQKSISNILKVKADSVFNDTTSLTIITTDGRLYAFLVHFESAPVKLTINLSMAVNVEQDTVLLGLAQKAMSQRNYLHGIKCSDSQVRLSILGVYTTGEQVLFKLKIENNSSLSYAVGGLQVMSKDVTTGKRRTSQERMVAPLLSFNQYTVVKQKGLQMLVIILPKPSLSNSRKLVFNISEKDGERNLSLSVSNRFLLNAILLL